MIGDHTLEDARDHAALYALGCLEGDEARAFETHLRAGCEICTAEVEAFAQVTAELGHTARPQPPRPEVRGRVLNQVKDAGAPSVVPDGMVFVREAQTAWQKIAVPAIEVKVLFEDKEHGIRTVLVRIPPGGSFPAHRHADVEETYVIEGDLSVCGIEMLAGDYCRAEPGSVHREVVSRAGCLFMTKASRYDEFIA